MKQYLLFDLDGTLTDPKLGITTCVQYALAHFGIDEPDLDKLEPFIGPPLKDSFMEFYHMDETQAQEAVDKYRERFRDTGIFENKVYAGIPKMLRTLNAKGLYLAVASSKPTVFVERILEHFEIAKYFKVVVGSELDGTRVEKEQVVEEALKQLFGDKPVEREKVYMIGDRRFDMEGARAQGVESVGVTYGYGSLEELKEAKADYIVRSVEELGKFLLRGTEELQKPTSFQKMWQLIFPFIMFILVRNVAAYVMQLLFLYAGGMGSGGAFFFLRDEEGILSGFTGNTIAILEAVSYIVGVAAVWNTVKLVLQTMAEDMHLAHLKREPIRNYMILGILTVCTVLGLNILLELSGMIQLSESYQSVQADQFSANLLLGLFCYGLITPISEELVFRGVVYGYLRRMINLKTAMIFSALIFGMYHGNLVQGIYGTLMGCLMVYAYEYFGNIKAAMAVHIIANLLAYGMSSTNTAVSGLVNVPSCVVFLAAAAGGMYLLYREKKVL